MKVEYLFSNNKKCGSRLISWAAKYEELGLEEVPSHVGVLLNGRIVVESTFFTGVRMLPYHKWLEINNEVAKIPCNDLHRPSNEVFKHLTDFWGKGYDWLGILYFAYKYIKLIAFKEPLPRHNRWEKKDKYFCTEFVAILTGCECSMHSPAKLLKDFTGTE